MRLISVVAALVGVLFAVPSLDACGPSVGVPSSTYTTSCYQQSYQQSYVQPALTVLAYPVTVLQVPTVTVPVQPVVPSSAPVQAAPVPVPAPAPQVQQQETQVQTTTTTVQAAPVVVRSQMYATYLAPALAVNSCAYGTAFGTGVGYGTGHVGRGVFVRTPTVDVHAQRQRAGFFQRHRAARAQRLTNRGARIGMNSGAGVPAAQIRIR